jgi:glutamate-ammonia-ligase adenylyltransferase
MGEIAPTLAAAETYYRDRASSWERLALVKARPVAGDRALGRRFLEAVRAFVFGRPFGPEALHEVREAKRRMDRRLLAQGEADRNVKLGFGGIREIEFVVHSLQLRFAGRRRALREKGTLCTLSALREARLLPAGQADALAKAYVFLRDVENKLQMAAGAQTHTLPSGSLALRSLARRLGYRDTPGVSAEAAFLSDCRSLTREAHRIFRKVFELKDGSREIG